MPDVEESITYHVTYLVTWYMHLLRRAKPDMLFSNHKQNGVWEGMKNLAIVLQFF